MKIAQAEAFLGVWAKCQKSRFLKMSKNAAADADLENFQKNFKYLVDCGKQRNVEKPTN